MTVFGPHDSPWRCGTVLLEVRKENVVVWENEVVGISLGLRDRQAAITTGTTGRSDNKERGLLQHWRRSTRGDDQALKHP